MTESLRVENLNQNFVFLWFFFLVSLASKLSMLELSALLKLSADISLGSFPLMAGIELPRFLDLDSLRPLS